MTPEEREKRLLALEKRNAAPTSAGLEVPDHAQTIAVNSGTRKRKFQSAGDSVKPTKAQHVERQIDSVVEREKRPVITGSLEHKKQSQEVINIDSDEDDTTQGTAIQKYLNGILPLRRSRGQSNALRYWDGQVLLTTAAGYPVQPHHISIERLFDRDNLRRAVLAAFQIDLEWVLSKLNIGRTAIHIACEAKTEGTKQQWQRLATQLPKLNMIFPPMNHANCMHSKLQLLFFDDFLRFVTPSANLMPYDWGETGTMENVMYVQDFPLKKLITGSDDTEDESESDSVKTPTFLADLTCFLRRSKYPGQIIADLEKYSFERATHVRFVASVGGENYAPHDIHKSGLPRLASAVQSLGWSLPAVEVEYITASIGALNKSFVSSFMRACQGQPPFDKDQAERHDSLVRKLRIYFPTRETVLGSRAGHAGTICFQSDYYGRPEFPRGSLMSHIPVRPGLLSHCKMILCRDVTDVTRGWAYVGSANFSASAWGDRIVRDRATKKDRMNCRNWECGVVVPMSLVRKVIPVQHTASKNTDPWYFMER
ncbi:Tyrosyl-DNA phosphodiesterase domain protein [Taphrina deformans PYCC 5710]|uniref:Tyrosyl-DNA phosphodiesterase domain protein n=1 Tax=Taphrina deformans (strain PYCC 5710 / ATCC 11124 / CBS 356.35 / IMI 108563 / JCM 9778 / NBRC 8474) TaxID=1097556 RepID=R4X6J4_TAPDE|nr:Tyrosyl-DNA phosphodiesterase domain protein [Taphrina deformans PYCC 5710]|eukprot:CCG80764.1 Tyrosyl-DNA phosphodiesterase domain protein [Taphrina deformans PYCC 5710]